MRPFLLLAFWIIACILPAQTVEDFVTGLITPSSLGIHEGVLYVVQEQIKSISKIDLSNASPTVEEVLTFTEESVPFILAIDGTYLYYSDYSQGTISRIEMGSINPAPQLILDNLDNPSGLTINEHTLYFGHDFERVSKIDLTESEPMIVDIIDGAWFATSLALNGNDLFIAEFDCFKISKVDVTGSMPSSVDVLTDLNTPIQFTLNGNELYFSEFYAGRLSKIDITTPNPTVEVLAINLDRPHGLAIDGSTLYFCQYSAGKISKIEDFMTNSYEVQEKPLLVYPNPVSDYLILEHPAKAVSAQIVNGMGQLMKTVQLSSNNTRIHTQDLNTGVYYLILEPGSSLKFIKTNN